MRDKVILVVDDWEIDRIRIVERLRHGVDATFVVARDGVAALEAIAAHKPDLVITDLVMPRMDGLRLVEHIRKRYSFLPSVLVASRGSEEIACRALEAGAVHFVPKQELGRLVDTVLSVLQLSLGCRQQERLRGYWQSTHAQFCLENDETAIPVLVSHLQQQASSLRALDDTECFRLGVALNEALHNAVQHGNLELNSDLRLEAGGPDLPDAGGGPRSDYYSLAELRRRQEPYRRRRVHISVWESPEGGRYTIRDDGPGFDRQQLGRNPTAAENICRPCGRGLFLIHTFMDRVEFNERGNEITMTHRYRPRDDDPAVRADGDGPGSRPVEAHAAWCGTC